MANNRIGCSAGKTSLIDPNNFSGQGSSDNISVPLEDLNISVQLSTFKKGRTILTADKTVKTSESSKTVSVTFIEGTEVNGQKVLTSKFTDLTTVFDKNNDSSENLGITNIDIDFNSSYAPLITINFLDLRGSSIFQNESQLNNNENKYSVFFQLPYPLYELEIKGYYGQPVKYCLHMTKFNSKFNAQTGNFEITANFIGYTYAMLSDMLLGILKAIPYTTKGDAKYKTAKSEDPKVLNLNELMIEIGLIDKNIEKVAANNPNAANLNSLKQMENNLNDMIFTINQLGSDIEDTTTKISGNYNFIVIKTPINTPAESLYKTTIESLIKTYNKNSVDASAGLWLDETFFAIPASVNKSTLSAIELSEANRGDANADVYKMRSLFDKINKHKTYVAIKKNDTEKLVAKTLKEEITKGLGFEPTIRNIVNCFTVAVEIFLSIIFDVSKEAEENSARKDELKSTFKTDDNHSDLKQSVTDKFYPWPDYRENTIDGYKEKYLGTLGVLTNPTVVNELQFIDELYSAFIIAKQKSDEALLEQNLETTTWIPVSPFDTVLYCKSPYDRLGSSATDSDVLIFIVLRAFVFLGYNTFGDVIDDTMINNMATSEVNLIKNNTTISSQTKQAVSTADITRYINKVGNYLDTTTLSPKRVIENMTGVGSSTAGPVYFYNYIFYQDLSLTIDPNNLSVIPLSDGFKGEWSNDLSPLSTKGETTVFLTNYTNDATIGATVPILPITPKKNDGGRYVDMLTPLEFYSNDIINKGFTESFKELSKSYSIQESQLASGNNLAYSLFSGLYGIQEYSKIDIVSNGVLFENSDLKYIFYKDNPGNLVETNNLNFVRDSGFNTGNVHSATYVPRITMYGYNRYLLNQQQTTATTPKINFSYLDLQIVGKSDGRIESVGLFASKLYYVQDKAGIYEQYNKALLFLNALPFNGNSFEVDEIRNLFNRVGGFIHAPRLWCAYIGGLLWRASYDIPKIENGLITGGGSGDGFPTPQNIESDPIYWQIFVPSYGSYKFYENSGTYFRRFDTFKILDGDNIKVDSILYNLPESVKDKFKDVFFSFVNGTSKYSVISWNDIKEYLEIWNGDSDSFINAVDGIYAANQYDSYLWANFINLSSYEYVVYAPWLDKTSSPRNFNNDGFSCEIKTNFGQIIVEAMREEIIIANSNPQIWLEPQVNNRSRNFISVKQSDFKTYVDTIIKGLSGTDFSQTAAFKKNAQDVFGTDNEDVIKLQLYKTCKNVYDKWIGGAQDGNNIVFQTCGGGKINRNDRDKFLAKKRDITEPKLIDSFRFVTRSFKDIGNDFYIDPRPVYTYLHDNPNSSFYGAVTDLLAANNFDFIALPSFINYNDPQTMESIFETYQYQEAVKDGICGPSFVCVYVGQTSKHLDFAGSEYTNDGFDVQCKDGTLYNLPLDFTTPAADYENNVAVFKVAYSQQNQNIFKDIILDQSEFSETEESLKVIDDISKTGSENQRHFGGQNLYSVYGVRSYKAEVEMMGNAMIQPMMYFQLDNIPMFHGAYMITHVKHSIKPNYMSTNFTGVRIRHPETPILTATEVYMSLLQNIEITATATTPAGNVPNILNPDADYWSLIAVSATEGGEMQDKSDVAQSIYNRLMTPNFAYGNSIKAIVTVPGQYDVMSHNINDWRAIKDAQTAMTAVINMKKLKYNVIYTKADAEKLLKDTIAALSDVKIQNDSITFVETRTEFLSNTSDITKVTTDITKPGAYGIKERVVNGARYNAFFWAYKGKQLYGVQAINLYSTIIPSPSSFNW